MARLPNFLIVNKWDRKSYIKATMSIIIIYDILYFITPFIKKLTLLQGIVGYILISFIPGFCILRLLKINVDSTKNILFSLGLSLSIIMLLGLTANMLLPIFGIVKPLTKNNVVILLNILTISLAIVSTCYGFENNNISEKKYCLELDNTVYSCTILVLVSILGSYIYTYDNNNLINIAVLSALSILPIIILKVDSKYYPYVIYTASLAILFNINLISLHLWSFDIFFEAYITREVLKTGFWNPTIYYKSNSLLLFTIMAPIYSMVCNTSYIWVLKIVFPTIFSFTPVALYVLYRKYKIHIKEKSLKFDNDLAIFSSLLFIYYYDFFKNMPDKQYIAELFFILILACIMNIIDWNYVPKKFTILFLSFALIVTHYGVGYMLMFALIVLAVKKIKDIQNYALFFSIFLIGWYIYTASGIVFDITAKLGEDILKRILKSKIVMGRSGISYATAQTQGVLWICFKLIYIILILLITIGVAQYVYRSRKDKIYYIVLVYYMYLTIQTLLTYGMGFDRVLQISLAVLSPLVIVGCAEIVHRIITKDAEKIKRYIKFFIAGYIIIFFAFNSGLIFQVSHSKTPPYCINLNKNAGWPVYSVEEVNCVMWLKHYAKKTYSVSTFNTWKKIKSRDGLILVEYFPDDTIIRATPNSTRVPYGTYIYLGRISIKMVKVTGLSKAGGYIMLNNTKFYRKVIQRSHRIYNNGYSVVYLSE